MLKQLTLAVCAAALLPACIITTDNSTSNSESNGATETDTTGTASGTTTTGDDGTDTTNDIQTTDTPTTADTTTDTPTTENPTTGMTSEMTSGTTTTEMTSGTTTGGVDPGCGWYAADKYYDCVTEENGVVAGMEDPEMISPIACADDLAEGDKCDSDNGPVTKVGCCTPEGVLFYCEDEVSNSIVKIDCNMLP